MSTSENIPEIFLNAKQAAEFCGVKIGTIYKWVGNRTVPYKKIPRSQLLRFRVSDLVEWIESGKVETIDEYLNPKEE